MKPLYVTTQDVARELGISTRRVQRLVKDGRLRATRFGQVWMIRARDVDAVRERKPGRPRVIAGGTP